MNKCSVTDCQNELLAKGMCSKHYYRVKRGGTAEISLKQQMALRICSIPGCGKQHVSNDYCAMHNGRYLRHGNPLYINPKCNRDGNYKQRARKNTAQWKKDNKQEYNVYLSARKARVKLATPNWIDLVIIEEIYRNRPEGHHVDHIVPINGKNVSGLHVPWNLQYLSEKENLAKSNKHK